MKYKKIVAMINLINPNIYLCLSPFGNYALIPKKSLINSSIKLCSIIHDLIPLKTKKYFFKNIDTQLKYFKTINKLKNYDVLLANSKFT